MSKPNGNQPPSAIQAVVTGLEARAGVLKSFLHDPSGEDVTRFINEVRLAVLQSPYLQACTMESIVRCCQEVAKFRRGIGPHGAWLVPFKQECTVVWDYRALMDMARDDGTVLDIDAGVVKVGDDFDFQKGTDEFLRHRPSMDVRGELQFVYAIATLKHGIKKFVVLDRADCERIRMRSRGGDKGPWQTDYNAMAMKTAIRQLVKLLPRSRGKDSMHRAIELEDGPPEAIEATPVQDNRRLMSGAEQAKQFVKQRLEGTIGAAPPVEVSPPPPGPIDPEEK